MYFAVLLHVLVVYRIQILSLDDFGSSVEGVFKINTHYFFLVLEMCLSCVATTRVNIQCRLESLKLDQLSMTLVRRLWAIS